ncbi:hypothetical protein D3C78_686920 [compost metagenome]
MAGVFPGRAQEAHPGGQDDPGIERQGLDLHLVHAQDPGLDKACVDRRALDQAALGEAPVAGCQLGIVVEQVFQVTVQEPVPPHGRQQLLQIEALVRNRGRTALGRAQEAFDQRLVLTEQHGDDRLLVGEVVVQVARRNLHVRGNMVGADAAFALLIEQLKTVLHDALAGFYPWGHGLGFNPECIDEHLTTYPSTDKSSLPEVVI